MPQHVIQRGVDRQAVFFDAHDYELYRESLWKPSVEHDCLVHAYVLMTNHTHLLLTPEQERSIPLVMQAQRAARFSLGTRSCSRRNGSTAGPRARANANAPRGRRASLRDFEILDGIDALPDEDTQAGEHGDEFARAGLQSETSDIDYRRHAADRSDTGLRGRTVCVGKVGFQAALRPSQATLVASKNCDWSTTRAQGRG